MSRLAALRPSRFAALLALAITACQPEVAPVAPPPPPTARPLIHQLAFDTGATGQYRSTRFQISLPLPDGHAWRIDDHKQTWLVATHAATSSELALRLWSEDARANAKSCEEAARLRRKIPDVADAEIVQRAEVDAPHGFDTRALLVVTPPRAPGGATRGMQLAFGGRMHRCFAFVYITTASGEGAEQAIGERLAAMQRTLRGIYAVDELDPGRRLEAQ